MDREAGRSRHLRKSRGWRACGAHRHRCKTKQTKGPAPTHLTPALLAISFKRGLKLGRMPAPAIVMTQQGKCLLAEVGNAFESRAGTSATEPWERPCHLSEQPSPPSPQPHLPEHQTALLPLVHARAAAPRRLAFLADRGRHKVSGIHRAHVVPWAAVPHVSSQPVLLQCPASTGQHQRIQMFSSSCWSA